MPERPYLLNDKLLIDVLCQGRQPMAVHVTEDATIEVANEAMIRVWGKDESVVGKTLAQALPELAGQPYLQQFRDVWNKGITISGRDAPADLIVNGILQTYYFDYEYRAIKDEQGNTCAILHTATDVTERYLSALREKELLDELTSINEELSATNEEIRASNEELARTNEELALSRESIRSLITQAPVGICLIRATDLFISEVNDAYLELVGKPRAAFEQMTIWEAVPEAAEVYAPVMRGVIDTAQRFVASEHELTLIRSDIPEQVFVNFVYEPIKGQDGLVEAVMVIVIDVTDQVHSRKAIAEAEERSRLAVEAAEAGLFDVDLRTGIPVVSGKFHEIFDLVEDPDEHTINRLTHPEDRLTRIAAHQRAEDSGALLYEARIFHRDGNMRWIRAQGKVIYDEQKKGRRLVGTVVDITEFKALQQQKDDFISIASHELKTPITSLKASLQLIDRMKDKPDQPMFPKFIMQARRSMERISSLVDDLLNVGKLQQAEIPLKREHFILSQLVSTVANPIAITGKKKITIDGDTELQVFADEHRIDQVLSNLISNAVKYAPESEAIEITIKERTQYTHVAIKDHGPGIPKEKQAHLFDRYYRVDSSGNHVSGLGLGLFISAEIIRQHGGLIGVISEPGEGSTFWFTLPHEV